MQEEINKIIHIKDYLRFKINKKFNNDDSFSNDGDNESSVQYHAYDTKISDASLYSMHPKKLSVDCNPDRKWNHVRIMSFNILSNNLSKNPFEFES